MESNIVKTHPKKKAPPASLHLQILNQVKENILSGKWQPGFRIPFEMEIAKEYGCSRMTVNKALTQLTRAGLLERTRKGGTFVKAPQSLSAALEITNIRKEVEDAGKTYSYNLLSDDVRGSTTAENTLVGLTKGAQIRELTCLHSANDMPFCYEERIINMASVPEVAGETFEDHAPGSWLLQQVPWNSAEHQIIASSASKEVAEILEIQEGNACLVIERRTQNDKGYVTWAKLSYSGDQHRLFATFTLNETI